MSDVFLSWCAVEMPKIELSYPDETDDLKTQIVSEFFGFIDGAYMRDTLDFRCLEPKDDAIWELKTVDLRIFGWFAAKNYFIAHVAKEKEKLKKWADYQPIFNEVSRFRAILANDLPPHNTGGYRDVVSIRS